MDTLTVAGPEPDVLSRLLAVDMLLRLTVKQRLAVLALAVGFGSGDVALLVGGHAARGARALRSRAAQRLAEAG